MAARQKSRVSMATVAARAGVSGQTVSRVVNDSPRVDPATRHRVEEAMSELGYRPHRAARALRTGRTQTIGLVAQTLATVGNSHMLQSVVEAAAARGYAVVVRTLGQDSDIVRAFEQVQDQGVDGAIVLNEAAALARNVAADGLRLVVVDAPEDSGLREIQSDHAAGADAATSRLIELGHRTVRHLAGPGDSFAAGERERGWRAALERGGIAPEAVVRGDWSADSGYAAGEQLASASAVFVANDQMALGLMRALAENGRRVPEDVSVIGFDDVPEAANYQPPLTSVRQDFAALAARAVEMLVADIEYGAAVERSVIPTFLVERASAGPAPKLSASGSA